MLSVIVLTYNALEYTKKCIEAIHKNTIVNYELIIIDNNSTDGTKEWIINEAKFNKARINANNLGVAGGRNLGVRESTGDTIVFLDNDTEVGTGWDQQIINDLHEYEIVGREGSMVQELDPLRFGPPILFNGRGEADVVAGYCFAFRRTAWDKVGEIYEGLPYPNFWHEDLDYCLRAKQIGIRVLMDTRIPIVHHQHKSMGEGVSGDEAIKVKPGFYENAKAIKERLENAIYYNRDYKGEECISSCDRISKGIVNALRKQGQCVIRKPSKYGDNRSLELCKAMDIEYKGKRYIGEMVENDRPPKSWTQEMIRYDGVLAGSGHCYKAFKGKGFDEQLQNINFIGLDPQVYNHHIEPIEELYPGLFKFLFIGATQPRKNTENLIKWYRETFTKKDKTILIIKDGDYGQRHNYEDMTKGEGARIEYVFDSMRESKHAQLLRAVALNGCYISPHRAEGFGMPQIEALAVGCRVGTTDWGGPSYTMRNEKGKVLPGVTLFDYELVLSKFHNWDGEPFYTPDEEPLWAEPNEYEVKRFMRDIYERGYPEEEKRDIIKTAKYIQEKYSYDNIATNLIQYINGNSK